MSELAADGIPVAVTCRVLNIARQPYYRWLAQPVGQAELVAAHRANALVDAHRDDPEFGYRFLVDEARATGQAMADRTAWRICSDNGWWSAFGKRKRRGKGRKGGPAVHDDLMHRDFTADGLRVIHIRQMRGDLPGRQSFRIQRQDRLVEPLQAASMLGHDPRRERPHPGPRNLNPHRPDLNLHRLRTVTNTNVDPPASRLVDAHLVKMSIQLGIER